MKPIVIGQYERALLDRRQRNPERQQAEHDPRPAEGAGAAREAREERAGDGRLCEGAHSGDSFVGVILRPTCFRACQR